MAILAKTRQLAFSPTLNTILMVENTLKSAPHSAVSIAELKRMLPKQVNHNTLKVILEYLEISRKILVSMKGITWIHNDSEKMKRALANSHRYPQDFSIRAR